MPVSNFSQSGFIRTSEPHFREIGYGRALRDEKSICFVRTKRDNIGGVKYGVICILGAQ